MYIPKHFVQEDQALLTEVMRAYNFALLISSQGDGETFATHLPLIVRTKNESTIIEGHMARGNPHWQFLERNPNAMIVFSGPHAYVSPSLYESKESVPTWNYIAVHAYGRVTLVHDAESKHTAQQRLVAAIDPAYRDRFDELRPDYLQSMIQGIVAFEMVVERLEGKFKLSQNRPMTDRRNVAAAFADGDAEQRAVASWMRRVSVKE
ncbi:MAG: FMN-binding negative transcriptional regulator [Pseudomonadota bacterium]|nr:FMN-binding negative transcriptional regulator [Pseudomonadota bacterium]